MQPAGRHLAIYNFGLFVAPYDDPAVEGFRLREPFNFDAAARSEGFVGRSGYQGEPGPRCWGEQVFPRFIHGSGFETAPSSLSLWADIESLMAFTYSGVHADALKHARNWNVQRQWPALVLWWVEAGRRPVWADGVSRLERLHDHGSGPNGFTFKEPFTASGEACVIDRARVRQIAQNNTTRQGHLLGHVLSLKA
ncbi:DUF3291 domain-containing protein [Rhizobium sp. 32-5/1]|uniref:DUF3291 domain-containing protein n=1 Tax=Rhizobium sp. 32-5/1 TaxID=3019602 RepID=UPI00240E9437|nr:DUF3291 domain-containing protein [Rhizobium sp. 32-5/1]WEZ82082.1 DUF3291 domain-containing protein [Rhizobium sp. 32-5/1]